MSLSDRLRAAEQQRRSGTTGTTDVDDSTLDLTSSDAAVIDLTARRRQSSGQRSGADGALQPYLFEPPSDEPMFAAGAAGISYNPVREGDASAAFGEPSALMADRMSTIVCPRCGGATQIDLFDQVHQTTSLSCLTCFHMFRVEA